MFGEVTTRNLPERETIMRFQVKNCIDPKTGFKKKSIPGAL